jgi:hypothetical protein
MVGITAGTAIVEVTAMFNMTAMVEVTAMFIVTAMVEVTTMTRIEALLDADHTLGIRLTPNTEYHRTETLALIYRAVIWRTTLRTSTNRILNTSRSKI